MNYAFISEFELLKHRHSHSNITREPWAEPGNRETATKYYKLKGARVEILRCNIEARRLVTSIRDEHALYEHTISHLETSAPLLAVAVQQTFNTRRRINNTHLARLEVLYALPGFTGIRGCGVRAAEGEMVGEGAALSGPSTADDAFEERDYDAAGALVGHEGASGDEDEPDDAMQSLLDGLARLVADDNIPDHMMHQWDSSQV